MPTTAAPIRAPTMTALMTRTGPIFDDIAGACNL
jgi:hypothetical protein